MALKIRGIYATALTKFFLDRGLTIVEPSPMIQERFGDNRQIDPLKSFDLEITDLDSSQGIMLQGQPEALDRVVELLREAFFDAVCRNRSRNRFQAFSEVEFPYLSKSSLDEFRNRVMPTLVNHHRLRIISSEYLDLMEEKGLFYPPLERESFGWNLEERLVWDAYGIGKKIGIEHVKLDGRLISLSEGEILEMDPKERKLTLKRTKFKGRGKYDGLGTSKMEGDYALSKVKGEKWFYKHTYLRQDGELIGTYYNINTFIEFYPDRIRYVDLEIDVVRWPDGRVQIIDEDRLNKHLEAGYITKTLKDRAMDTARELKRMEVR